jgi:hypothetical protein
MKTVTLSKLKETLQKIFNAYIRERDKDKPCISCGKFKPIIQAGHYWTVRMYDALRFDEDNCHGECPGCNGFDPCHLIGYTENLKDRIGIERYNSLKSRAGDYKMNGHKWTRVELIEKIEYFKRKINELS